MQVTIVCIQDGYYHKIRTKVNGRYIFSLERQIYRKRQMLFIFVLGAYVRVKLCALFYEAILISA